MRKLTLVASFLFVAICAIKAQSYETLSKWNKKQEPAVAIEVDATRKVALETLYDLLRSEKLKGKKSKKELKFEQVTFPSISTDYINLYATVEQKDNNTSVVAVFVNKGLNSNFISSSVDSDLVTRLRNYLDTRYLPEAAKASLEVKVKAQEELIKKEEKQLKKLQKNLEKRLKERDKLMNEIDKANAQVAKQKQLVEQQRENLVTLKSSAK